MAFTTGIVSFSMDGLSGIFYNFYFVIGQYSEVTELFISKIIEIIKSSKNNWAHIH